MYNGHAWELTDEERATNEVNACIDTVEVYPDNEYWQTRLANAIVEEYYIYNPELRSVSEPIEDEKFIMLVAAASFEFPWTDAEVASEEDNHRPEVSL